METMTFNDFMNYANNEGLKKVYDCMDNNKDIPAIELTFMGKKVEIDLHADNYESLIQFLQSVKDNDYHINNA
jgi:hypothetical protein